LHFALKHLSSAVHKRCICFIGRVLGIDLCINPTLKPKEQAIDIPQENNPTAHGDHGDGEKRKDNRKEIVVGDLERR